MKGTVHKCTQELVVQNFGEEKWQQILREAGFDEDHVFMLNEDVDEGKTMKLITEAAPKVLGITVQQVIDAFSNHWVNIYAPKLYPVYFEGIKTAKEFLINLDNLHIKVTNTIAGAKPPRFKYNWIADNVLEMEYMSNRGLVALFISMAKAVAKYYNNEMDIANNGNLVTITFK